MENKQMRQGQTVDCHMYKRGPTVKLMITDQVSQFLGKLAMCSGQG